MPVRKSLLRASPSLVALATLLGVVSSASVFAGVYRWVDAQGTVHYADTPPSAPAEQEAEPPGPVARSEAHEYVRLIFGAGFQDVLMAQMTKMVTTSVKTGLEAQLTRKLSSVEEGKLRRVVDRVVREVYPPSMWENEVVRLVEKYYSEDEVRELLRFYRTPLGAKSVRLAGPLAAEGAAVGERLAKSKEAQFLRRFQEELRKEFPR